MNSDEFSKVLKDTSDKIVSVLGTKADEYAFAGDRLSNFKRAAQIMNSTPEKALLSFVTKHITSIFDMVDSLPGKDFPMELWGEKIIDIINYMILLRALCVERIEKQINKQVRLCRLYAADDPRVYFCNYDEGDSCKHGTSWETCEYGGKKYENRN